MSQGDFQIPPAYEKLKGTDFGGGKSHSTQDGKSFFSIGCVPEIFAPGSEALGQAGPSETDGKWAGSSSNENAVREGLDSAKE